MRSEYYSVVNDVDGVEYANIKISDVAYSNSNNDQTPPSVDLNGNLIVADHEVITKWEVTVTEI
jgi:hypothetical protein